MSQAGKDPERLVGTAVAGWTTRRRRWAERLPTDGRTERAAALLRNAAGARHQPANLRVRLRP